MEHLKKQVVKMKPEDRYCTVIFDKMTIHTGLHYNINSDIMEGFQSQTNGHRQI